MAMNTGWCRVDVNVVPFSKYHVATCEFENFSRSNDITMPASIRVRY